MDEPISNGKKLQCQPKANLERYLWLPAEHSSDMPDEVWMQEIEIMFAASKLTRRFIEGCLSPEDYSDALADLGYDPHELGELWESGVSLGY